MVLWFAEMNYLLNKDAKFKGNLTGNLSGFPFVCWLIYKCYFVYIQKIGIIHAVSKGVFA